MPSLKIRMRRRRRISERRAGISTKTPKYLRGPLIQA